MKKVFFSVLLALSMILPVLSFAVAPCGGVIADSALHPYRFNPDNIYAEVSENGKRYRVSVTGSDWMIIPLSLDVAAKLEEIARLTADENINREGFWEVTLYGYDDGKTIFVFDIAEVQGMKSAKDTTKL